MYAPLEGRTPRGARDFRDQASDQVDSLWLIGEHRIAGQIDAEPAGGPPRGCPRWEDPIVCMPYSEGGIGYCPDPESPGVSALPGEPSDCLLGDPSGGPPGRAAACAEGDDDPP